MGKIMAEAPKCTPVVTCRYPILFMGNLHSCLIHIPVGCKHGNVPDNPGPPKSDDP